MMRRTATKPPPAPTRFEALKLAIEAFGTHEAAADALGVSQSTVSRWISSSKQMPGEYVLKAEAATGVSRHHLRPDLYPLDLPPGPRWYGVDMSVAGDQTAVSVWRNGKNGNRFIGLDTSVQRIAR